MKLYSVNTGYFKLDGGAMFGVVPKSIWSKTNPADEDNLCKLAMRSLLIEDEGRLILIDTGMGDKQDAKFFSHYVIPEEDDTLEGSLAILGFMKEDITDVILTHLHFDHCGGAIVRVNDELVSAFPNATFWSNEEHWQWAIHPNEREQPSFRKENILPIEASGKLKFISVADTSMTNNLLASVPSSITKNISIRFANGHTKAMMLPQLKYKDRTIVFVTDLLPTVGHIPLLYVMSYDMFPWLTLQERKSFFKEAAENDYVLFLLHDAINECCTLQQTEKGIRLKEIFKIGDV